MISTWARTVLVLAFIAATVYAAHRVEARRVENVRIASAQVCHSLNEDIAQVNLHGEILKAHLLTEPVGSKARRLAGQVIEVELHDCEAEARSVKRRDAE